MAKSTRSKTKRSFRRAKREEFEKSTYAVTHAARLERLSRKLAVIAQAPVLPTSLSTANISKSSTSTSQESGDIKGIEEEQADQAAVVAALGDSEEIMDLDNKKISTHGRRLSRNQEWRAAKGFPTLKKSGKLNRKGDLTATRKAGRSKRRR